MQSMASLMSDVAAIGDFDDEDDSVNNGIHFFPPNFPLYYHLSCQ